jgi:hypothetical protein
MNIENTAQLISFLLEQMSADMRYEADELSGEREIILFGVREMLQLGLLTAECEYSEISDANGPLLASASNICLTKRGVNFKRH